VVERLKTIAARRRWKNKLAIVSISHQGGEPLLFEVPRSSVRYDIALSRAVDATSIRGDYDCIPQQWDCSLTILHCSYALRRVLSLALHRVVDLSVAVPGYPDVFAIRGLVTRWYEEHPGGVEVQIEGGVLRRGPSGGF